VSRAAQRKFDLSEGKIVLYQRREAVHLQELRMAEQDLASARALSENDEAFVQLQEFQIQQLSGQISRSRDSSAKYFSVG